MVYGYSNTQIINYPNMMQTAGWHNILTKTLENTQIPNKCSLSLTFRSSEVRNPCWGADASSSVEDDEWTATHHLHQLLYFPIHHIWSVKSLGQSTLPLVVIGRQSFSVVHWHSEWWCQLASLIVVIYQAPVLQLILRWSSLQHEVKNMSI